MRQSAKEVDVRAMNLEEISEQHEDLSSRMDNACVKSEQLYGEVTPSFVLQTLTHSGTSLNIASTAVTANYGRVRKECTSPAWVPKQTEESPGARFESRCN